MPAAERPYFAIALRIVATMLIAGMMALVKFAGEAGISLPEILFWRQALTLPVILAALWLMGNLGRLRTTRLGSHAKRAIVGTFGMACHFLGVTMLPLPESTTLGFTAPLFVVLISALVMREYVGPWRWTAVLLGFIGVLLIAQPGGHPIPPLGAAAALGSGLTVAIVNFQIRGLSLSETPESIVFYLGLFSSMITATLLPFFAAAHTAHEWLLLGGIGMLGLSSQVLITLSLRYAPIVTVIVIDYSMLIWTMLLGWLVWAHVPPLATWLGAPVIIAAGLIIAWRQHVLAKPVPQSVEADSAGA